MNPRIEALPIGDIVERIKDGVPRPVTFTVTASPGRGMRVTIDVASQISRLGHHVVPHISARLTHGGAHLRRMLTDLTAAGVSEVFVVGGDAPEPVGEFASGAELLQAMSGIDHGMRIGVPGYPEGHPLISDAELDAALETKSQWADYIVTQMCFDAPTISTWVEKVRARGIDAPVYAGVPGPISPIKLLRISAKVGVGESLRVLKAHRGGARLASPKPWDPTELAGQVLADPQIAGLHVYSFNEVAAAYRWHEGGQFR